MSHYILYNVESNTFTVIFNCLDEWAAINHPIAKKYRDFLKDNNKKEDAIRVCLYSDQDINNSFDQWEEWYG